jgi:glucose/arabinose dehydrogenase
MPARYTLLITLLLVALPVPVGAVLPPGGTFIDDDGNAHEGAIEAISAQNITAGCDPVNGDQYCPADSVTRASMAVFLIRALGEEGSLPGYQGYFTDVPPGLWYTASVERLFELGVTDGFGDGTYRPDQLVTRAEMAAFLLRVRGEEPSPSYAGVFSDVTEGAWYARYVERLFQLEITTGCDTAPLKYCPAAAVRRDEMATFLLRTVGLTPDVPPARPSASSVTLKLETVATGLQQPVFVDAPTGDNRLFIVDQPGTIRVVDNTGKLLGTPFLDIQAEVQFSGERGLLGMAFHPDYATNGKFYVNFTDTSGDTQVVEYRLSPDPSMAAPSTKRVLLVVDQPAGNHNGGMLAFGPDGFLYIAMGDGGGGGDTYGNGQNTSTLHGALLRIDVDGAVPYAVPTDNPFVGKAGADEIWVYGVRNPWRFSFDGQRLYVADVGQSAREEIDLLDTGDGGANLGWSIMEGSQCFGGGCSSAGLVLPLVEYTHAEGCSITGGYVYRGSVIPELYGHYFYGDFCGGWIKSFRYSGGTSTTDHQDWTADFGSIGGLTSFGTDGSGEIYVTSTSGSVYRIVGG